MTEEIAVIGNPEFTTGFRLAGVREFAEVPDDRKSTDLDAAVKETMADDNIGIVVMYEDDLEYLSREVRQEVERSVEPVVVTLGGGAGSGNLREQIKRAIGIDLMDDDQTEP